jgi:hypothetical protein
MVAVVEMQDQQVGQVVAVVAGEPPCCWSMDQQLTLPPEAAEVVVVQITAVLLQPAIPLVLPTEIPQVETAPVMAEVVAEVVVVRAQEAAQDLTMPMGDLQVVQVAQLLEQWVQMATAQAGPTAHIGRAG